MTRYKVVSRAAVFGPGVVLHLSKEQVAIRSHRLRKARGGHEPLELIEFKQGEELGIVSGEVPKRTLEQLQDEEHASEQDGSSDGDGDGDPDAEAAAAAGEGSAAGATPGASKAPAPAQPAKPARPGA